MTDDLDVRSIYHFTAKWEKQRDDDLNTILIVVSFLSHVSLHELTRRQASLFSAVISAFIIYIQPQLQPDPEDQSAALLHVILYKMDNTTFGGDVPELPTWNGPPSTAVAALVLLYLSLAVTMCSVVISILMKQLLNLRTAICPKVLNIDSQHFRSLFKALPLLVHMIILLLSFVLQLALILFSCALTMYVWKINHLVAVFILILTICAVLLNTFYIAIAFYYFAISYILPIILRNRS